MNQLLVAEILSSDSDEITELRANVPLLEGFVDLAKEIEKLPGISKRFYEESRSLYQATCDSRKIEDLEAVLATFFGPPVKPAGKPLPRKLKKNATVNYLGGIKNDQSLFLLHLKTGEFYGALWPWQRNKSKIEIHLGYCSDWITNDDYNQIETLIKRSLSKSAFEQMDTAVGGQIHGISLPSFLQMAEMERSSFTLRITANDLIGRLFVQNGQLIEAQTENLSGRLAAYQIISWDNATIEIAPADDTKSDQIKQPLMHVLMESLKIKDEMTASAETPPSPPQPKRKAKARQQQPQTPGKPLVRLERTPLPPPPKRKVRPAFAITALTLFLILLGAIFTIPILLEKNRSAERRYQNLISETENMSPRESLAMLEIFLQENPNSRYKKQIREKMDQARQAVEDQEFEEINLKVSKLEVNEAYEEKAISLYARFLEKYPDSRHSERINQNISDIKELLDQFYYEELKRAARLDFKNRLATYRDYLSKSPQGRYRRDVELLIAEMGRQYYDYLKTEAKECEQNRRWEPCIDRTTAFIEAYTDFELAEKAKQLKTELLDKRDLYNLRQTAQEAGKDYFKTFQAYKHYLEGHPQSTQKAVIQAELKDLEKKLVEQRQWLAVNSYATNPGNSILSRIQKVERYLQSNLSGVYAAEAQDLKNQLESIKQDELRRQQLAAKKQEALLRLQQQKEKMVQQQRRARELRLEMEQKLASSTRYQANGDGTVTDLSTGLVWNLLDTYQELGGCLTYEDATKYVSSLKLGNRTDWRLPTASELASIYKQEPFFPASGAAWYWSSESYAKGFHTVVNIVTAKPETIFIREDRRIDACGTVRAVRP